VAPSELKRGKSVSATWPGAPARMRRRTLTSGAGCTIQLSASDRACSIVASFTSNRRIRTAATAMHATGKNASTMTVVMFIDLILRRTVAHGLCGNSQKLLFVPSLWSRGRAELIFLKPMCDAAPPPRTPDGSELA